MKCFRCNKDKVKVLCEDCFKSLENLRATFGLPFELKKKSMDFLRFTSLIGGIILLVFIFFVIFIDKNLSVYTKVLFLISFFMLGVLVAREVVKEIIRLLFLREFYEAKFLKRELFKGRISFYVVLPLLSFLFLFLNFYRCYDILQIETCFKGLFIVGLSILSFVAGLGLGYYSYTPWIKGLKN